MTVKTYPFDAARYIQTAEEAAFFIQAIIDEAADANDPRILIDALGDVARSKGMTEIAAKTGLTRQGLYKALGPDGNPSFDTVMRVLAALGLRLTAEPVTRAA
ncbi:MAG: putative addiction module antidote protein [Alphaproteobacteria bacterium]|nr:putative addiction module antidote protein [Alphaproteobacteria bacterium]